MVDAQKFAESGADLRLAGIRKEYPGFTAIDGVDLTIPAGSFFALLGPSGCGKTTTLRLVAGLEEASAGQILIGGNDVTHLKPHRRPVNTVFQSYALFPHMTVLENVAFGLRRRRVGDPLAKAHEALKLSSSTTCPIASPLSSPVGSSSAWHWPGRWSTGRRSCCSMSRWVLSI